MQKSLVSSVTATCVVSGNNDIVVVEKYFLPWAAVPVNCNFPTDEVVHDGVCGTLNLV